MGARDERHEEQRHENGGSQALREASDASLHRRPLYERGFGVSTWPAFALATRNGSPNGDPARHPRGPRRRAHWTMLGSRPCDPVCEAAWGLVCRGAASRPIFMPNMAPHLRFLLASSKFCMYKRPESFGTGRTVDLPGSVRGVGGSVDGDSGGVMTNTWGEGWVRRGVPHILLPLVAMLVSGCFHVGPSAKQAMTSAAPGARQHAGRAGARHADGPFDLEKPAVQSRVDGLPDAPARLLRRRLVARAPSTSPR